MAGTSTKPKFDFSFHDIIFKPSLSSNSFLCCSVCFPFYLSFPPVSFTASYAIILFLLHQTSQWGLGCWDMTFKHGFYRTRDTEGGETEKRKRGWVSLPSEHFFNTSLKNHLFSPLLNYPQLLCSPTVYISFFLAHAGTHFFFCCSLCTPSNNLFTMLEHKDRREREKRGRKPHIESHNFNQPDVKKP